MKRLGMGQLRRNLAGGCVVRLVFVTDEIGGGCDFGCVLGRHFEFEGRWLKGSFVGVDLGNVRFRFDGR